MPTLLVLNGNETCVEHVRADFGLLEQPARLSRIEFAMTYTTE